MYAPVDNVNSDLLPEQKFHNKFYWYFSDKAKTDKDTGQVIHHLNDDQKALVIRYDKDPFNSFIPKSGSSNIKKIPNFILHDMEKQTVPHKSIAQ